MGATEKVVQETTPVADQALLRRQDRIVLCLVGVLHPVADPRVHFGVDRFYLWGY